MRKLRVLFSLLLLLVLPVQGYAMARMALLGPDCDAHAPPQVKHAQLELRQAVDAEAGMPCHDMQPTAHESAPQSGADHGCVKCPLCALHAGAPARAPMPPAGIAPRDAPGGLFAEPATVYLDLPLPVPRG